LCQELDFELLHFYPSIPQGRLFRYLRAGCFDISGGMAEKDLYNIGLSLKKAVIRVETIFMRRIIHPEVSKDEQL
jgi:hypothetical protein